MAETQDDVQLVRRILRVNHAGEHGAVAIYTAQLAWSAKRFPDLNAWLRETLSHELEHRDRFRAAMPSRSAKPCRLISVWSIGGGVLGSLTSKLGIFGIMACTAAVERTVHRHLDEQVEYLRSRDAELADIILSVQSEERAHLAYAEDRHDTRAFSARVVTLFVAAATEALIWLSTRGDSLRLRAALRRASKQLV